MDRQTKDAAGVDYLDYWTVRWWELGDPPLQLRHYISNYNGGTHLVRAELHESTNKVVCYARGVWMNALPIGKSAFATEEEADRARLAHIAEEVAKLEEKTDHLKRLLAIGRLVIERQAPIELPETITLHLKT